MSNKLNIKLILIVGVVIILCMYLLHTWFGFYYETVDDPQFKLSVSAYNADYIIFFNLFHINTLTVFKALYQFNNNVYWYDTIMYTLLGIGILQFIFYIKLKWKLGSLAVILLTFFVCLLLIPDYIIFSNLTRIVILLSAGTVLLFEEIIYQKKLSAWYSLLALIFLLPAFSIRLEAAILSVVISGAFIIIERRSALLSKSHIVLFCVILISGFSSKYSAMSRNQSDNYKSIAEAEPYVFSLLDMFYLKYPPQLNDTNDTLRFELLKNFYIGDRAVLDVNFFKKITDKSIFNLDKLGRWQFNLQRVTFMLYEIINRFWPLLIIIGTFSMMVYISGSSLKEAWWPIMYVAGIIVLLMVIAYLTKMRNHIMDPILGIGLLLGITAIGKSQMIKKPYKLAFLIMAIALSIVNYIFVKNSLNAANQSHSQKNECRAYIQDMEYKHVVFDIFTAQVLFTNPFEKIEFNDKQFYVYDSPYLIAQSQLKESAQLTYADFFKELNNLNDDVAFISLEKRMELMAGLLQTFYNGNITYKPINIACPPIVDANFPVTDSFKVFELLNYQE